ncbi:MAG: TrkA family potassium uptake protein [Clostridia bacterium]|nr:TrkA family potassium uptake protein [Clostridia bacterium]
MSKKSFMILGAGRFGISLAETLSKLGHEVFVIDSDEDVVQNVSETVTHAIIGDCCDESVLRSVGVSNFDTVIVALSENMKSSILATVLLKELNAKYIIARAIDKTHMKILEKIGADMVVMPETEMGEKLAYQITSSKFLDYIELSDKFSIAEIACPPKWIDKTLAELNVRGKYGINVIAVEHNEEIKIIPDPDYKIRAKDIFVVIGSNDDIQALK